jgi:hypothetical protein
LGRKNVRLQDTAAAWHEDRERLGVARSGPGRLHSNSPLSRHKGLSGVLSPVRPTPKSLVGEPPATALC